MAPIQLRRPVIGRERGDKFGPNVYKLSMKRINDALILRE